MVVQLVQSMQNAQVKFPFSTSLFMKIHTFPSISTQNFRNRIVLHSFLIFTLFQVKHDFRVLVLSDSTKDADSNSVERPDLWYNMMSLLRRREIYKPQITDKDTVITINLTNILGSTSRVLKANFELVSQDWGTRQIPRFRYVI